MSLACRLLVLAVLLAPTAAAQPAAAATLAVEAVCLPQLPSCVAPGDDCAALAPPGGTVSLRVRATRGGEPLALARLVADERALWTSTTGHARVPFAGEDGPALLQVTLAEADATVSHALRRASLAVHLVEPPTVADALDPPLLRVRVVDAATGQPVEAARVLAQVGEDALDVGPTDADGHAATRLRASSEPEQVVAILDAARCGLPVAALPDAFTLSWRIPEREPRPTLALYVPTGWAPGPLFEVNHAALGPRPPHRLEWRLAAGDWQPGPILVPEGVHAVEARVVDAVGRASNVTRATVRVDSTPPSVFLPSGWTPCAPLPAAASDALSGLAWARLVVDGAESPLAAPLPDGAHAVRLEAMDHAGHVSQASARVLCDADAPSVAAMGDLSAWSRCTHAAWTVQDAASGLADLSATLDGRSVPVLREPGVARVALHEGVSTVTLRARDAAGNLRESVATARCDRSPPLLDLVADAPPRVTARASDAHSGLTGVRVRVDDGPWMDAASVTLEGEGTRVVRAEATDALGHVATATREVRVDVLAPRLSAPALAAAGSAFDVLVEDASLAAVEASTGDAWATLAPAEPGRYPVRLDATRAEGVVLVRARDAAGNVAAVEITVTAPATLPPAADVPARPPAQSEAPPAATAPPRAAPVRLESVVVSVLDEAGESQVRLSGLVEGIEDGEAFLVAPDGRREPLGPVRVEAGVLRLEASSRLEGTYALELDLRTASGARLVHDAGTVTLAAARDDAARVDGAREVSAVGLLALVALALAAAGRRKA